jgi:hypothetical protein
VDDRAIIGKWFNDVLVRAILLRSNCFESTDLRRVFIQLLMFLVVNTLFEMLGSVSGMLRGFLGLEVAAALRLSHLSCYFSFLEGNLVGDEGLST